MSDPFTLSSGDRSHLDRLAESYAPEVRIGICRASVRHSLPADGLLARLIEERRAAWAVEVKCPKTLMSRVDTSLEVRQEVEWKVGDVDGDVCLTPGVVSLRGSAMQGSATSGYSALSGSPPKGTFRQDTALRAPPGWWLARGAMRRAKPLASSFVGYRLAEDLESGRMAVTPVESNGRLRFVVALAPDVFDRIQSDQALQVAALAGVCGRFPRIFRRGGHGRHEHSLAQEIRRWLAEDNAGVRLWDDRDYDPVLATALEPIRLLAESGPPYVSDRLLAKAAGPFREWQSGMIFRPKHHGKREHADSRARASIRRRQEELTDAVAGGAHGWGIYLRNKLGLSPDGEFGAPPFPRKELMPLEAREPSRELEEELAEAWKGRVRPRMASQPLFWLICHIEWIEQGRFGSAGRRRAGAFTDGRGEKTIEGRTRNFLRRAGGLPVARGNVSVFSDCPLARAWWRRHLAEEVERTTQGRLTSGNAHEVFHANRSAWEELAMVSLRRMTVVNQPRARAAIVWKLNRRLQSRGRIDHRDVAAVAGSLARQGSRRSLEHVPWQELLASRAGGRFRSRERAPAVPPPSRTR